LGIVVDYSLGIFLHFDRRMVAYPPVGDQQQWMENLLRGTRGFDGREYAIRVLRGFTFWGDHFAPAAAALQLGSIVLAAGALFMLIQWRNRQFAAAEIARAAASKRLKAKKL
jgi:hypothetical protein